MRSRYLALFLLPLALAGCDRAMQTTQPVAAPALGAQAFVPLASPQSSLDALWPNEDGRRWDYDFRFDEYAHFNPHAFPTRQQVPEAPFPEEVVRFLPDRRIPPPGSGDPVLTTTGQYSLEFQGQKTTQSGATGQNLVQTLVQDPPAAGRPRVATVLGRDFLSRLALARPDLRARLESLARAVPQDAPTPLLIQGGAWVKTAEYIGGYGDIDQQLAWKYLQSPVRAGSRFDFQLLPSITTDVFLHALVLPKHSAVRWKDLAHEIEVVYVIDYGVSELVDDTGSSLGFFRDVDYGSVVYEPGTGPARLFERLLAPSDDLAHPRGDIRLSLTQVTPGGGVVAAR